MYQYFPSYKHITYKFINRAKGILEEFFTAKKKLKKNKNKYIKTYLIN